MTRDEYKAILTSAIGNEVESYEFYRDVAEKTADPNVKKMFLELAADEQNHKKLLESFLSRSSSFMKFSESPDYKISETLEMPPLSTHLKPAEAITLAIKKEEEAMKMYATCSEASDDDAQKKMFLELSLMEKGHKTNLEEYYTQIAFAEVW